MLNKLTIAQEDRLPEIRDEWLAIGLSTEPADRTRAQAGAVAAYEAAGLPAPKIFLWLDSPMAGAIGAQMLPEVMKEAGSQVGDQVWGQVGDQVRDQVWDQVGDQVWDQVWGQVGDQVRGQVWDQVGDQVRGQVWDQVRDQVGGQVGGQVGDQVRDQVWDQVRDQVGGQVGGQVGDQVWGQVWDQVWDQVWGQVGDQVWDQVWDQVRDQVRGQVWGQVRGQVRGQVWGQVRGQVGGQVRKAVYGQHDAGWLAHYATFAEFGIKAAERLHGLNEVAQSSGWWWTFQGAVIFTERPVELHRDQNGALHAEDGPALRYPDGWGINAWHGVRVPADFFTWNLERALKESNSEIRRCAIERIGWENLIDRLTLVAEADDPGNTPHTIRLYDLPGDMQLYADKARLLVVHNASVNKGGHRRVFGLPVPARHSDPIAAAAELFDVPAAAYRQLVRAS